MPLSDSTSPVVREPQRGRRPLTRRGRFALASASLVFAMTVAEVGLRCVGLNFAAPYIFDEHCGARLTPSAGFWQSGEGRVYITTNGEGFRDRAHARPKPKGTFRIAVLGDSFAEALQVPIDAAFWSVLQRELTACPALNGQQVEVLNFGVSGFGTTQELQLLRHHVWDYQPDLVLVAFLPGNDVRNNCRRLEPQQDRPFYDLVDGELRLDESFRDRRPTAWIRFKDGCVRGSRVLGLIYRVKQNWRDRRTAAQDLKSTSEHGLDAGVYAPPRDAVLEEAWQITAGVLRLMHDEVRAHGARFVMVVLNNAIEVHPSAQTADAAARDLGVDDLDYPDRRLTEIAAAHGFPLLTLTPAMRGRARETGVFFHGFPNTAPGVGHWNEQGHKVAGELTAAFLCRRPELLRTTTPSSALDYNGP